MAFVAPLPVVETVDLERYTGKWYEISSFPQSFQKNCACTEANYSIKKNGKVKVLNRCYNVKKRKWESATGTAYPVEGGNNAKLKVSFFWPFKGDYYIIALEKDYSHVMVGAPDRKYLWILSRTKGGDAAVIDKYKKRAIELGFDISKLVQTSQDCG
jgi:apolipoprotein D and lipocalin family protein